MSTLISIPGASRAAGGNKSRKKSNITLHIPTSLQDVRDNYCLQALAQTTMDFCRDSTLHGKHIVVDIQELGSSYSRQKRFNKLLSLVIWVSACVMGAVFAIVLMGLVWDFSLLATFISEERAKVNLKQYLSRLLVK